MGMGDLEGSLGLEGLVRLLGLEASGWWMVNGGCRIVLWSHTLDTMERSADNSRLRL